MTQVPFYRGDVLSSYLASIRHGEFDFGNLSKKVTLFFNSIYGCSDSYLVNSGRGGLEAIILAMELAGMIKHRRVLVSPITFPGCISMLNIRGFEIVVGDCIDNGNLDPLSIPDMKLDFILVTHMWGVPCDMEELLSKTSIPVVEDFSHAHFSSLNGVHVGCMGVASFASLQRKKILSVGEGGIVISNNDALSSYLGEIVSPGSSNPEDMSGYGVNLRMSPFGMVALVEQLENREYIFSIRNKRVYHIEEQLRNCGLEVVYRPPNSTINWYSYKPRIPRECFQKLALDIEAFEYDFSHEALYWDKVGKTKPEVISTSGLQRFLTDRVSISLLS